MRKLIYYVACSLDGFIAREDGSIDFALPDGEHLQDLARRFPETFPGHLRGPLGISAPNQRFDTVLMGRATYEVGLKMGITSPYPHLRQYLFSRTIADSPDPAVELVQNDPAAAIRGLKQESGKDIWLCGGARLAAAVFSEIDELILKFNPVVLGTGIPLVAGRHEASLELVDSRTYANGCMVVHYGVGRRPVGSSPTRLQSDRGSGLGTRGSAEPVATRGNQPFNLGPLPLITTGFAEPRAPSPDKIAV